MSIRGKKSNNLHRKRDHIKIISQVNTPSQYGGQTKGKEVVLYDNFADMVRLSDYRLIQNGLSTDELAYRCDINKLVISKSLGDFNLDFNDDFLVYLKRKGITPVNTFVLFKGRKYTIHTIVDTDDNLEDKIRITCYAKGF